MTVPSVDLKTNLDFWIDGRFAPLDEPCFYADEHFANYGTGGIEGACTYRRPNNVVIFRPIDRFVRFREETAKELFLEVKWTPEELTEITKELIRRNEAKIKSGEVIRTMFRGEVLEFREPPDRWYIRPHVRHRARSLGVYTPPDTGVLIFIEPFDKYHGEEAFKKGAALKIVDERRIDPRSLSSKAKLIPFYTVGYKAAKKAKEANATEAILLDMWGYVADGSGGSISMIKNGVLYIPRKHSSLDGIVRKSVAQLAKKELGMKVKRTDFSPKQLYEADEVLLTGNAAEVMHVREVDGHLIGDGSIGPYVKQLQNMFFGIVYDDPNLFPNCGKYQHWMEPVYSYKTSEVI
ncbi:MAG: aminotransferase class IV [Candidatus Aenigmarchaeota archaeon]|nr:aminotransferase class IV [Candidatus Aenigmarchaeota archaeon]